MAFPELQQIANNALFSSAGFGVPVTYTPPGGPPQTFNGIFFIRPVVVEAFDLQARLHSSEFVLDVRVGDLAAGRLVTGATALIAGVLYEVRGIEETDDGLVSRCTLHRPRG